ncbi:MAG: hypothetical protein ACYCW6_21685, partial [Candidatus Xenobia bacterium]
MYLKPNGATSVATPTPLQHVARDGSAVSGAESSGHCHPTGRASRLTVKASLLAESAEVATQAWSTNPVAVAVTTGTTGIALTTLGVQQLSNGLHERCLEEALEGSSALLLGLRSSAPAGVDGGLPGARSRGGP